ncbi:MAG TPA: hypothetical protein IGS40_28930 [Trichormus sp. M33_DOE_039]|nr:hypothetical protein [Trichormus sp. M33_DOE_039]
MGGFGRDFLISELVQAIFWFPRSDRCCYHVGDRFLFLGRLGRNICHLTYSCT